MKTTRDPLIMEHDLRQIFDVGTPEGYEIVTYRHSYGRAWHGIIEDSYGSEFPTDVKYRNIIGDPFFSPEGFFFAIHKNILVGTSYARIKKEDELRQGWLYMLGVVREHQGHGLGHALTTRVLLFLRNKGYGTCILYTDDERLPAIKVYLNLGFKAKYKDQTHRTRWITIYRKLEKAKPSIEMNLDDWRW